MTRMGFNVLRGLLATTALYAVGTLAAAAQEAAPAATRLQPVTAEGQAADAPFETPAAVSRVTPEQIREGGDTNRLLETVPGVAAGGFSSQPGVSVNIRGLEGVGRVNMMVEGVRQNFRPAGHEGGSFAYIDPAFLSGIDVERGAISGPSGMGALVGAVNFRLLNVEDILRPGQTMGGRLTGMTGTNGYQWNASLIGAARLGEGISVLAGASGRTNSAYENGRGQTVPNTEQSLRSGLFRLNWDPNPEHRLALTGSVYTNRFVSNFYDQTMQSNLIRLAYNFRPSDNPWIDLQASASYNQIRMNNYLTEAGAFSTTASGRRIVNSAYEVGLSNTSRFALGGADVEWLYGAQYATDDTETRKGGVNGDGRLSMTGVYSQATVTRGIFDAVLGLRYDRFDIDAEGYAAPAIGVPVTGPYSVDRGEGRVSPRLTLAVRPLPGLQFYATYGWAFRPPTISETMYSGPHSAGGTSTFYPNPYLQPERSQGWEIGTNVLRRNLFMDGDRLRVKVAYFDNDVEDLINLVAVRGSSITGASRSFNFYENVPGTSRLSGVEIEGGYDTGLAYFNVAYTHTSIDYADGADRSYLPRSNLTFDAGVRLFERQLTLGARLRVVGRTQSASTAATAVPINSYTTGDLYGSWRMNDNLTAFFNVTNISNQTYTLPASETVDGGRGRTIIGGLTLRF
ncbi:TonB-dependent receptor [Roseomonas hellenica]|uniref:TonB-dependent receptor n=1 Tax=Plastoroseomonas hellenica TaxID=2687306 RepID=A0ABS5ESR8_9PROT|nr:TonB-dependent receptor [Plastoroseomonas hellenica]MBR0662955.1 TonB-dependent receptor [Plastoroseomonas hellenica]